MLKNYIDNIEDFFENFTKKINDFFANATKNSFRKDIKTRISLYKVLVSSMAYKNTIKQSITKRREKLVKRHDKKNIIIKKFTRAGSKEMPFLDNINEKLLEGEDFATATKGWVTDNEQMIMDSGSSGELSKSLIMAQDLLESLNIMKNTVISAMIYPVILFIVLFAMIFGFSYSIIPILVDLLPVENWEGSQLVFYNFCMFFQYNSQYIIMTLFLSFIIIVKTMSKWTGKARKYADYMIPWSIYKEFNSGIFLISFSTLIESGNTPLQALQKLRVQSPKYVKKEIDIMLANINQAMNPATAINTGFLGEVGDDIEDIAENGDFEKILKSYGEDAIEKIIASIKKKTGNLKNLLMISVVGFLIWGYSAFIMISQNVTKAAGF